MKIEKEKLKVNIFLKDNLMINGFVHINPGERLQDFINDNRESFIAVTEAEFCYIEQANFKPTSMVKKGNIILDKSSIWWIEEA